MKLIANGDDGDWLNERLRLTNPADLGEIPIAPPLPLRLSFNTSVAGVLRCAPTPATAISISARGGSGSPSPANSELPRLDYPPIRTVRLSPAPYETGMETHQLDGVSVKVYGREKTLANCFKHRNEVGLNTVLEAVRRYKAQGRVDVDAILRYAAVCRVARVARPYLEALLG